MDTALPAAKPRLGLDPLRGFPSEVGRWLWALEDVRQRLKADVAGLPPHALDWLPQFAANSIGTLLYHIAATEIDWLYEVLPDVPPAAVTALLPHQYHTPGGQLTPVTGVPLSEHIDRLDRTRAHLLDRFRAIPVGDFRRIREHTAFEVSPEWVLYHLIEHESLHRGQILALMHAAARARVHESQQSDRA
jgi:uncharacterized damage-inducible protein DinB